MEAGLRLGLKKLLGLGVKNAARRLLLLSDGQANQGISTPEGLSKIAAKAREMGASVSTFGVGADYNEDLMAAIAEAAGGNYHVIDRGQELAEVFQKEFDELGSLVGSQVSLEIRLPEGLELEEAFGYPLKTRKGVPSLVLRDLYHGMRTKVVWKMKVTRKAPEKGTGELGVTLHFADARDAEEWSQKATTAFRWSARDGEEAKARDARVAAIVEEVEGARTLEVATQAYSQGKVAEAKRLLTRQMRRNQAVQAEVGEEGKRLEVQNSFLQKVMDSFGTSLSSSRSGKAVVKASKQGARLFRY
jgi:Ca-activated chloride channel family protein